MTTLVFGHKSPDTDATGSAIIWSWFLAHHEPGAAEPRVLGTPNTEAQFVLNRWGFETPKLLTDLPEGTPVVIVDTNNPAELPDNINKADIQAIIDHHKLVGGLETKGPNEITIRPVACTATLLYQLMGDAAATAPREIKGAMLSCILSDTLEFRSPTTTAHDKAVAEKLAADLGVNIADLAAKMFEAKSDVSAFSDAELLRMDSKEYNVAGKELRVSVLETTAPKVVLDRKASLMASMVDVAREDGGHVAGRLQQVVHAVPVVAVAALQPAWMVQEQEHVVGALGLLQHGGQPLVLLDAHLLRGGLVEGLQARRRIALVGVQRDEPAVLVLERVPQRAEVQLVVGLVLALGLRALAAPVDVVVAHHGEPGAQELVHDPLELAHLRQPLGLLVVALDQVADGHDEVGLEQVDLGHRLVEHGDALGRAASAVAEHDEGEGVLLLGQGELEGALARGQEAPRVLRLWVGLAAGGVLRPVGLLVVGRGRSGQQQSGEEGDEGGAHRQGETGGGHAGHGTASGSGRGEARLCLKCGFVIIRRVHSERGQLDQRCQQKGWGGCLHGRWRDLKDAISYCAGGRQPLTYGLSTWVARTTALIASPTVGAPSSFSNGR